MNYTQLYKAPTPPGPRTPQGKRLALLSIVTVSLGLAGAALGSGLVESTPAVNPVAPTLMQSDSSRSNLREMMRETLETIQPAPLPDQPLSLAIEPAQPHNAVLIPESVIPAAEVKTAPRRSPQFAPGVDPMAFAFRQQIAKAEAGLRSGQFEAVLDFGDGTRSTARVLFDLGSAEDTPRFHLVSTYQNSATSAQTYERITIGKQTWDRQADNSWIESLAQAGVREQVQDFLPQVGLVAAPQLKNTLSRPILRWRDAGAGTDVILHFDPTTGTPQQLRQLTLATKATLTINYVSWNAKSIEIKSPLTPIDLAAKSVPLTEDNSFFAVSNNQEIN
ncbi:MAG: hypothetical protein U0401_26070 [Anaerolineae bacterium]